MVNKFYQHQNRGASIIEVILAMAIIAIAAPFVYSQIAKTNRVMHQIVSARKIIDTRESVLNFIRMNQDKWPDVAQIRLVPDELGAISPDVAAGFIDKYSVNGATITDVYLAFKVGQDELDALKVAKHIGGDASVVGPDLIAYGNTWAVSAPDFAPGDLIYRITRDVAGEDTSKYLHRATSGEDNLNVMERDLDMDGHHVYNVATMSAESARIKNGSATFIDTDTLESNMIYFSSGANISDGDVIFKNVRVSGDMTGFKNIYADNINGKKYTTIGRIISDRVTVAESVNVANDLVLKSDSSHTISGFTGISVNSVYAPFISAEEMIFYDNFGLTISGELLMSTTSPLKIGNWVFPSTKPPLFSKFELARAELPTVPSRNEFSSLMRSGWRATPSAQVPSTTPSKRK